MTLDTVFRIASMTKAVTCVAAMQLVEQGTLGVDEPVPGIDPALSSPQVLEGFDAGGVPKLRPAKRPITLRHLMTHTAGFSYEVWDPNYWIDRSRRVTGVIMTQILPFADPRALQLYGKFERGVYDALNAA